MYKKIIMTFIILFAIDKVACLIVNIISRHENKNRVLKCSNINVDNFIFNFQREKLIFMEMF